MRNGTSEVKKTTMSQCVRPLIPLRPLDTFLALAGRAFERPAVLPLLLRRQT